MSILDKIINALKGSNVRIGGKEVQGPSLKPKDVAKRRAAANLPTRAKNAPNAQADKAGRPTRSSVATKSYAEKRREGNKTATKKGKRAPSTPGLRGTFGLPTSGKNTKPGIRQGDLVPEKIKEVEDKPHEYASDKVMRGMKYFNDRDRPWVFDPLKQQAEDGSVQMPSGFDIGEAIDVSAAIPVGRASRVAGTGFKEFLSEGAKKGTKTKSGKALAKEADNAVKNKSRRMVESFRERMGKSADEAIDLKDAKKVAKKNSDANLASGKKSKAPTKSKAAKKKVDPRQPKPADSYYEYKNKKRSA